MEQHIKSFGNFVEAWSYGEGNNIAEVWVGRGTSSAIHLTLKQEIRTLHKGNTLDKDKLYSNLRSFLFSKLTHFVVYAYDNLRFKAGVH